MQQFNPHDINPSIASLYAEIKKNKEKKKKKKKKEKKKKKKKKEEEEEGEEEYTWVLRTMRGGVHPIHTKKELSTSRMRKSVEVM